MSDTNADSHTAGDKRNGDNTFELALVDELSAR
jgi:hypothetical protein